MVWIAMTKRHELQMHLTRIGNVPKSKRHGTIQWENDIRTILQDKLNNSRLYLS